MLSSEIEVVVEFGVPLRELYETMLALCYNSTIGVEGLLTEPLEGLQDLKVLEQRSSRLASTWGFGMRNLRFKMICCSVYTVIWSKNFVEAVWNKHKGSSRSWQGKVGRKPDAAA